MTIPEFYAQLGLELTPTGDRWKTTCPFHLDSNPSFVVFPDGSYHCFGCGAHGHIRNIQEAFNLEFAFITGIPDDCNPLPRWVGQIKKKMEAQLIDKLKEKPAKVKFRAYDMFDSLFQDAKCLAGENVEKRELHEFLLGGFEKITNKIARLS
jgi:hypothetical protein